jgi:hypothetical protein
MSPLQPLILVQTSQRIIMVGKSSHLRMLKVFSYDRSICLYTYRPTRERHLRQKMDYPLNSCGVFLDYEGTATVEGKSLTLCTYFR